MNENKEEKKDNDDLIEEKDLEEFNEEETIKKLEEELLKIIEKENNEQNKHLRLFFAYGLHHNFFIHVIIMFFVNLFSLSAIIGIANLGIIDNIVYYLLGVLFFTFLETFVRLIMHRFFSRVLSMSYGLINLIYLGPIYYFSIIYFGSLHFVKIYQSVLVFIGFLATRAFLSYYIKILTYGRAKK